MSFVVISHVTDEASCEAQGGDYQGDDTECASVVCEIEPEPECGNGILESGEECDDGNNDDGDGCQADCTRPGGITQPIPEPSTLIMLALAFVAMILYGWYRRRQATQE